MTSVAKNTVVKLLRDLGTACANAHDRLVRGLRCRRLQCDEIWSYCYAKAKNVPDEKRGQFGYGDVWTWVCLCADTKLAVGYRVDHRDAVAAHEFMLDVAGRVMNRVQLTSDGHAVYLSAVENAFGDEVDFAQLVRLYGPEVTGSGPERKYSPGRCNGSNEVPQRSMPDRKHVSTSYVKRQNPTMRMSMRRFTRLTNAFSRKVENLMHAVSIHFFHYNFVRVHQTLKTTPAVAAGIAERAWSIEDMIGLMPN